MIDDDLAQLEAELKRLRPVAPPTAIAGRIARELAPRQPRAAILRFGWVALPIAAGLAVVVALGQRFSHLVGPDNRTGPASGVQFKPVAAQNILLGSKDEGTATLADGTIVRRTRESYLDTITWRNSATNASLTWSVPREEVRVVPVSYQ
jgi:hypothetical protein